MKKTITFLAAMVLAAGIMTAQEAPVLTSKSGIPILPQAGDFAIGVNAIPMFEFVGNMFNNQVNNTVGFEFLDNDMRFIFGKYFLEDLLAVRVGLRVGHTRFSDIQYVNNDAAAAGGGGSKGDGDTWITDKHNSVNTNIMLGIGMEKRKGVHRIQGFYGLDLGLGLMSGSDKFVYGNEYSKDNTTPTTTNFGNNIFWGAGRVTQIQQGTGFIIGARLFVGFEYFILPKLSLGGEFGWGPALGLMGKTSTTVEGWDMVKDELKVEELPLFKGSMLNIDTDNANGVIKMLFHF